MTSREVGPYELIEPLGHGGMGLVYLARHRKLDRLVAMKLLPAHHQTAEARVRFEREILAAGRLQHPSIVSATDAGQFGDMDYIDSSWKLVIRQRVCHSNVEGVGQVRPSKAHDVA